VSCGKWRDWERILPGLAAYLKKPALAFRRGSRRWAATNGFLRGSRLSDTRRQPASSSRRRPFTGVVPSPHAGSNVFPMETTAGTRGGDSAGNGAVSDIFLKFCSVGESHGIGDWRRRECFGESRQNPASSRFDASRSGVSDRSRSMSLRQTPRAPRMLGATGIRLNRGTHFPHFHKQITSIFRPARSRAGKRCGGEAIFRRLQGQFPAGLAGGLELGSVRRTGSWARRREADFLG
jgi:hypothetical protein